MREFSDEENMFVKQISGCDKTGRFEQKTRWVGRKSQSPPPPNMQGQPRDRTHLQLEGGVRSRSDRPGMRDACGMAKAR